MWVQSMHCWMRWDPREGWRVDVSLGSLRPEQASMSDVRVGRHTTWPSFKNRKKTTSPFPSKSSSSPSSPSDQSMKRIDISCASQASTAICSSMENKTNPSSSSSSVHCLGDRAIDRHNPIIRDARRSVWSSRPITPPCSSSNYSPINPIPYHQLQQKTRPNSLFPSKSSVDNPNKNQSRTDQTKNKKNKKRSVHSILTRSFSSKTETASTVTKDVSPKPQLGHSRTTPSGSTRYLLGRTGSTDGLSDHDLALATSLAQTRSNNDQDQDHHQIVASKPTSSSLSSRFKSASNQVVVLRVSLHCKGCEGKVRKHLSRMEGVTSFNIDFAAKKVTVVGDITPVGVLASVSKVKNAQFWTSSSTQ